MSLKNITLRINDASDTVQTHQIAGGTGGAGSRGQALRLKALANVKYHFTDEATGFAPENLATKRVGKDLHIAFEGGQVGQPDLVIEDYYQDDGAIGYAEGSDNLLVGTHENGQTYPFVPESAQASDAVSQLAEGIQAGQALGISHAPVPLWWLPLLALPLLGGGGSTPPPDHQPEISGLTPKAQGGDVKVYEKALTTGSDAASPAERGDAAFTIKSQDGVKSLTIGGTEFLKDGAIVTGAKLVTPLGNELTVTGYDKATGEVRYSYLLKGSKTHPAGAAENALFEDLQVVLTDNDGDKATAVLSAQIVDDVPTARDDAFTQVQENQALVIDALANDIQGADGVPLAKVAVTQQPVQGTVSYDAATGKFTYTPNPGAGKDSTEDSFRYTITDADGDTSTATVKITLQPDQDIWIVPQDFVTVSEGALPSPAAPVLRMRMLARAVESAEAEGQLVVSYYNDVPQGDLLQSIQLSADGLDAQLQALGQDVVWALSADGLQLTGTSAGTPVLTIALTSAALTDATTGQITYSYKVTLLQPVTHPETPAGKNLVTLKGVAFTVTDADQESKTGTFDVDVQDAVPVALDDVADVQPDVGQAVSGNVLVNDTQGADGARVSAVVASQLGSASQAVGDAAVEVAGQYGTLTISADGSYRYARTDGSAGGVEDVFTYTLTDADLDSVEATLTIRVGNATPTVGEEEPNPQDPDGDPIHVIAAAQVHEAGLPARTGEPAGSAAASDSETTVGQFGFASIDGLKALTLDGVAVQAGTAFPAEPLLADATGQLWAYYTFDAATGQGTVHYQYTLLDNTLTDPSSVAFAVEVTDQDGQSASNTLTVVIVDDVPTAEPDTGSVPSGTYAPIEGNVMTNDTEGADGAEVVGVQAVAGDVQEAGTEVLGQYGTLTLNADGSYSYQRDAATTEGGVTDVFTYTIQDGDGDTATATLTITIEDSAPTTPVIPVAGQDGAVVHESGLPARTGEPEGSDETADTETTSGTITFTSKDGVSEVKLGSLVLTGTAQSVSDATGKLEAYYTYEPATGAGVIHYSYTLLDNTLADPDSVSFAVAVKDLDGDPAPAADLVINIVDDAPTAELDTNSVPSGTYAPIEGNVMANDTEGADGAEVVGVQAGAGDVQEAGTEVPGQYGTLTLNADGSYSYQRDAATTEGGVTDVFTYTIQDGDGDTATATLTITIEDSTPTAPVIPVAGQDGAVVYESGLPARTGEPEGSDETADTETTSGTITFTSKDGVSEVKLGSLVLTGTAQSVSDATGKLEAYYTYEPTTGAGVIHYSYTLLDNTLADPDSVSFAVAVKDLDGDPAPAADLVISIVDDMPTAELDTHTVPSGSHDAVTGNVMDNDTEGADGATVTQVVPTTAATAAVTVSESGDTTITGKYGVLTISADGSYSYQRDADSPGDVEDVFTYTLTDGDNDTDTATLTISIGNATPSITDLTPSTAGGDATVYEMALDGQGSKPALTSESAQGSFKIQSPDGIKLLTIGSTIVIADDVFTAAVITTPMGNELNIQSYDAATGEVVYIYTLKDAEQHTKPDLDTELFEHFTVQLVDQDDDTIGSTLSVKIVDDVPSILANATAAPALTVDETTLTTDATVAIPAALFTVTAGADGEASRVYSLAVDAAVESGLVDTATGETVLLKLVGDKVLGYVSDAGTEVTVFELSLVGDTSLKLDQQRAVKHADPATQDESVSVAAAAVQLTLTVTDGDGDIAKESVNLGTSLQFYDDAPTVKQPATALLDDDAQPNANTTAGETYLKEASGTGLFTPGADGLDSLTLTPPAMTVIHVCEFGVATQHAVSWIPYAPENPGDGYNLVGSISVKGESITAAQLLVKEDGSYTYTQFKPVAHGTASSDGLEEDASFAFGIAVTDGDGDKASTTLTVKINDDVPVADTVTADVVLDDDAQLGGNAGGAGDVTDAKAIARTVAGKLFSAGADGMQSLLLEAATGDLAMKAIYVDASAGRMATQEAITWTQAGDLAANGYVTLTGTSDSITKVAVLTVYADGSYAYEQFVPVVSSKPTTAPDGVEETDTFSFSVTVKDGDGDTAKATLKVQINDDTPVDAMVNAVTVKNKAGNAPVFSLDTLDKAFADSYGADGGSVRFNPDLHGQPALGADGKGMVAGGLPITYVLSDDGLVLQAVTNHGTTAQSEVFKVTLDPANSEYSLVMTRPVDLTKEIDFSADSGYAFKGGLETWNGFYALTVDQSKDLLLTGVKANGTPGTVNTSTGSGGVDDNLMEQGETMRIDYVIDLQPAAVPQGYTFQQHYVAQGAGIGFMHKDNVAVNLRAVDDTNDGENTGSYTLADGVTDPVTTVAVMYGTSTYLFSRGVTPPTENGGFAVTFKDDGTADLSNIMIGTQVAVYTADGYNRLEVKALTPDIKFKVTEPVSAVLNELDYQFKLPLQLVDGDGDLAASQLDITLAGIAEPPTMVLQDVPAVRVSEEGLPHGLPDTDGLVPGDDTTNVTTVTVATGAVLFSDTNSLLAELSFQFNSPIGAYTSGGKTVLWDRAMAGEITGYIETGTGREDVITVKMGDISAVTGETDQYQAGYTVTLHQPLDHQLQGEDVLDIDFEVKVFDGRFYSKPQTLTVQVEDDSPVVTSVQHEVAVPVDSLVVNNLQAGFIGYVLDNGNEVPSGNRFDNDADDYIDKVQWGGWSGYSSYSLVDNPAFVGTGSAAPLGEIFKLGDFTHVNNPISGAALDYVTVELTFDVTVNGVKQTLTGQFKLDHTETPNSGPHPDDIITIAPVSGSGGTVLPDGSLKFVLDNEAGEGQYALVIKGFRNAAGNYVQRVTSKEESSNSFEIYAVVEAEHEVAPVSSNIFANGGLQTGADHTPQSDVVWAVHTSQWGTFIGKADGSYTFTLSDYGQLNVGIGGSHTETISYDYRDADGDLVTGSVEIVLEGYKNWEDAVDPDSTDPLYLQGTANADTLAGGAAADYLVGGAGNDTLTGNAGADRFVFNAPLGSGNVDTITDFGNGADKLVLSALMFEGLTAGGTVNLVVDGAATTADPTVLYDSTTGMLSYDADGNGAGPAVDFAKLQSLAPLTSSDFMII